MEDYLKGSLSFYTGEYEGSFTRALMDNNVWFHDHWSYATYQWFEDDPTFSANFRVMLENTAREFKPLRDVGVVGPTNVIVWRATPKQAIAAAEQFGRSLKADYEGKIYCGDDQHYDYLPDAMEALFQFCLHIGGAEAKTIYNETKDFLVSAHFNGPDEEITFLEWDEG